MVYRGASRPVVQWHVKSHKKIVLFLLHLKRKKKEKLIALLCGTTRRAADSDKPRDVIRVHL